MELLEFATEMLEEYHSRLYTYLDGLTTEELNWRPDSSANSIAFIVWHPARVEDRWVQLFCQGKSDLWIDGRWFDKLGMDEKQQVARYNPKELEDFPILTMDELKSYFEAVRSETQKYLVNIGPGELEKAPGRAPFPESSSASPFAEFTIQRMFEIPFYQPVLEEGLRAALRNALDQLGF